MQFGHNWFAQSDSASYFGRRTSNIFHEECLTFTRFETPLHFTKTYWKKMYVKTWNTFFSNQCIYVIRPFYVGRIQFNFSYLQNSHKVEKFFLKLIELETNIIGKFWSFPLFAWGFYFDTWQRHQSWNLAPMYVTYQRLFPTFNVLNL